MAILKFINKNRRNLKDVISYICDENKTSSQYIFGCFMSPEFPYEQFILTKQLAQINEEKKSYIHVILSMKCNLNIGMDTILHISMAVGDVLSQKKYQVLGAIHFKNEANIHCHYIINSVGLDCKRYKQGKSLRSYKKIINSLLINVSIDPIYYFGSEYEALE